MWKKKIYKLWVLIEILLKEFCSKSEVIKMSVSFDYSGKIIKSNWGDDINYWFYKEIIDAHLISYDWSVRSQIQKRPFIMGIGSILTLFPLDNSIIWGSGIISETAIIKGRPLEVRAVRGPLTRQRLLAEGIDCPEVYGDPALLLPYYYRPQLKKKYRLGIIPHYVDQSKPFVQKICNYKDVLIIDVKGYRHWLDFIDQICQCEAIISSSLHGLIISEAYDVPNLWIKFQDSELDDDFKYHDFFLSIKNDRTPFIVNCCTTKDELFEALRNWKKGNINLDLLLDVCPFPIKKNIKITR